MALLLVHLLVAGDTDGCMEIEGAAGPAVMDGDDVVVFPPAPTGVLGPWRALGELRVRGLPDVPEGVLACLLALNDGVDAAKRAYPVIAFLQLPGAKAGVGLDAEVLDALVATE